MKIATHNGNKEVKKAYLLPEINGLLFFAHKIDNYWNISEKTRGVAFVINKPTKKEAIKCFMEIMESRAPSQIKAIKKTLLEFPVIN